MNWKLLIFFSFLPLIPLWSQDFSSAWRQYYNLDMEYLVIPEQVDQDEITGIFYVSSLDSSRGVWIIETTDSYDATNHVGQDEHNKVNFITHGAFKGNSFTTFTYFPVFGIRHAYPDSTPIWQLFYDQEIAIRDEMESKARAQIIQQLGNNEYMPINGWDSGIFTPIQDMRLHPDWEAYGKNVWKRKEESMRPFLGKPRILWMLKHKSPK